MITVSVQHMHFDLEHVVVMWIYQPDLELRTVDTDTWTASVMSRHLVAQKAGMLKFQFYLLFLFDKTYYLLIGAI